MKNTLNNLTNSEALFVSSTWWETKYPLDPSSKIRSKLGSTKPPLVGYDLCSIFTKRNQIVADTFAGTGGLLLGADMAGRIAIGSEINPVMINAINLVRDKFGFSDRDILPVDESDFRFHLNVTESDALSWLKDTDSNSVHFVMTDPPYGVAHKINIKEGNFSLDKLEPDEGWGKLESFELFLDKMYEWGWQVRRVLKQNKYVAVFMSDRYINGSYYPLAFYTHQVLSESGLIPKSIRIWRNASSEGRLRPYAKGTGHYVPNIRHQYILIHRKS